MTGIPLDERCLTCSCGKIDETNLRCTVYQFPVKKWNLGCPFAKKEEIVNEDKKINPLKASRRSMKGQ